MFADLDRTLRKLLEDPLVAPPMAGVDISFRTPDKTFVVAEKTLDLFLYGVRENRVLRDPVPILELVGGGYVRRTPPLRVDCDYIVTAWSKLTGDDAAIEERTVLAEALMKLSRFPTIPPAYLQGLLIDPPFPVQMWVAQSDDSKSLGEFWSALGVSPRSSFHLMLTIAMELEASVPEGPPVVTRELRLDDDLDPTTVGESVFAIGGVVRDAAGVVAGAEVTVDGARSARTDDEGRFLFSGLVAGGYTLRATAPGHVPRDKAVTVPAPVINAYDITFPP